MDDPRPGAVVPGGGRGPGRAGPARRRHQPPGPVRALLRVGYFLQGAATTEDRRSCERDLLAEYRAALDLPDGARPGPDEVWLRYRASTAYGLAIWLATAASTWQRPEVSLALVQRYAAAADDLDSAAAVGRLAA